MERADRRLVKNQPYDESVEVSDSAEDASIYGRSQAEHGRNRRVRGLMSAHSSSDECDEEREPQRVKGPINRQGGVSPNEEEDESEEDSESDSDDDDETAEAPEGAYDPADYANLPVSTEIKELFQYIVRYTPQSVELEHSLRPFIPDFIPAVGDIDAFLKVPRPDVKPDGLGMLVLDEPSVKQSDPTVLSLWLSEETKQHGNTKVKVTSVSSPHSNPRAIDSWVDSIGALHRSKAAASVQYARAMPDIDTLMQEWPPDVEETLGDVHLPHAGLQCSLPQYCDIVCALLDVPVYCSRIQGLHLLFSLYLEFRDSQHFART